MYIFVYIYIYMYIYIYKYIYKFIYVHYIYYIRVIVHKALKTKECSNIRTCSRCSNMFGVFEHVPGVFEQQNVFQVFENRSRSGAHLRLRCGCDAKALRKCCVGFANTLSNIYKYLSLSFLLSLSLSTYKN